MNWRRSLSKIPDSFLSVVLLVNLVAEVGIVFTGGLVRLTGSGLGCPTWPQCVPGSYTPVVQQAQGFHKYIEFGNRTLTSVVGVLAVLSIVAAWELARRGTDRYVRYWSVAVLAGVAFQAVLGGITVLTGLNPWLVAAHFLASMVLVAVSAATWDVPRLTPTADFAAAPLRWLAGVTAAVGGVVLVLGTVVTGSGPHSGDAATPARTGFDPRSISWLHADVVMLFTGLVVGLTVLSTVAGGSTMRRRCLQLLAVTLLQAVIGYSQYFLGLPVVLVLLHMLGASLLVVALVRVITPLRPPRRAAASRGTRTLAHA